MKTKNVLLGVCILLAFSLSSCNREPLEILPGSWDVEGGGTVIFNSDGTGMTEGTTHFNFDCGTLNGTLYGPYPDFTWEVTEDDGKVLVMSFSHESSGSTGVNCSQTNSNPMKIKSKTKIQLGVNAVILDTRFILTKK